jgi:UPF0716 protein FxsA
MGIGLIAAVILLLPLIEIAGFVVVGRWLGVLGTLLAVVASALFGLILVRRQGLGLVEQFRRGLRARDGSIAPLVDGMLLLVAGIFFILPGFSTDLVGFLLLVPPIRHWLAGVVMRRVAVTAPGPWRPEHPGRPPVIEGEFLELDQPRRGEPDEPPSPVPPPGPWGRS